ncbi:MAG: 2-oxoglutarate/2-oxoacid ferredoxin oxidoreductase subunit alpha [Thermotogaceae bacterium]|nr:2-oxoglutarate/2-oxoacid ferredoxin oxidoreductase subunit alpha [Thermotogaceae bacterium]MDN5338042.1 2-oxoglutarate/2-oxoacid ferredoxin oxidoreductase subunit alpha [Thermotogaceae bacterium]
MANRKFVFMQGDEACALGAIKAGCRFFAAYPITPASEIAETMARELPKYDGAFIQMEDEIASAAAIVGASIAGVKSMTATSGPGFSLMQEVIGFASMAEIPCVFVDVQRVGPSTGLPTKPSQGDVMQARWGTHGDHPIIVLYPSTVEEVYRHIITAFNLSERFRTPVIFLMDELLGHMRESFYLPSDDELEIIPRMNDDISDEEIYHPFGTEMEIPNPLRAMGKSKFHISGLIHDETGFPVGTSDIASKLLKRLENKIKLHTDEISIYEEYLVDDMEILLIAYGSVARSALRALRIARNDGIKVGLFKPITIWPFPSNRLRKLMKNVDAVIVAEMNLGQIIKEVALLRHPGLKLEPLNRVDGELITPEDFLEAIANIRLKLNEF